MGAIKDIVDLTKDLESRAKDRRDMDTIHKIQTLAFSLQSQHADIVERDVRVMQENAEAQRQIADLKRELAQAQAEDVCIHRGIEFRRGSRTRDKWLGFCPKCHMPAQDAWLTHGRGKVVTCTAKCDWQVFEKMKLEEIAAELGGDVMPNHALQRTAAPPSA